MLSEDCSQKPLRSPINLSSLPQTLSNLFDGPVISSPTTSSFFSLSCLFLSSPLYSLFFTFFSLFHLLPCLSPISSYFSLFHFHTPEILPLIKNQIDTMDMNTPAQMSQMVDTFCLCRIILLLSVGLITKPPTMLALAKTLHFGLGDNILFSSWMISNAGGYFGTIVFTMSLATLRVVVSNYAFSLQGKNWLP